MNPISSAHCPWQKHNALHTFNVHFCIRRPQVLLKSGYPAITEELDRRAQQALCNFEARPQHSLAVPKQQPLNPPLRLFSFYPPTHTLRASASLVITRGQTEGAQVLCTAKKRVTRRARTMELTFCGKRAMFSKNNMRHALPNTQSHALPTSGSLAVTPAQMQMCKLLAVLQS